MNWGEIKSLVKLAIGNRTDLDTQIILAINNGYLDLISILEIPDQFNRHKKLTLDFPELDQNFRTTLSDILIVNSGTVSVTNGSVTVTSNTIATSLGGVWNNTVRAKDRFSTDGGVTKFEISGVTKGTDGLTGDSLQLKTAYTGTTDSAAVYQITGFPDTRSQPTGTIFIKRVINKTLNQRLEKTSIEFVEKQGFVSRGKPTHYVRESTEIVLFPPPDDAYTIRVSVRRKPVILQSSTSDTLVPEIDSSWHMGIVSAAEYHLFKDVLGEENNAALSKQYFQQYLRERIGLNAAEKPDERWVLKPHPDLLK